MKKIITTLPVAEAMRQARADLRLENAAVPEWSHHIFVRVESGHLSLTEARREIDQQVRLRIARP